MAKLFSQKNPDKAAEVTIRHPREQKELLKKKKKKKKKRKKNKSQLHWEPLTLILRNI